MDAKRNLDPKLRAALDATGLQWTAEFGGRHIHIRLAGRLAGIAPRARPSNVGRGGANTIAQVRRLAREILGQ